VREISAGYHWDGYHGAFDDWLHESGAIAEPDAWTGAYRIDQAYHRYVAQRYDTATYRVVGEEEAPDEPGWQTIDSVPYRDGRFGLRHIVVLKRSR